MRSISFASLASSLGMLAIAGCDSDLGQQQEADPYVGLQDAVKAKLRDPNSAIFSNIRDGKLLYVCGEVNAKNGFGGYAGSKRFKAAHVGGRWNIEWEDESVPFLHKLFVEDCPPVS